MLRNDSGVASSQLERSTVLNGVSMDGDAGTTVYRLNESLGWVVVG